MNRPSGLTALAIFNFIVAFFNLIYPVRFV